MPPATKKPKRSFQSKWLSTYKWLVYKYQALFCSICLDAGMQNTYTTGTTNMRVSDIRKHGRSREHQRAIPVAEQKRAGSTTLELLERQFLKQEKAILAALTNVYWLAKEELPMLKYESLNQLVEFQGCTALSNLRVAKNAKYTHSSIVDEFQDAL